MGEGTSVIVLQLKLSSKLKFRLVFMSAGLNTADVLSAVNGHPSQEKTVV